MGRSKRIQYLVSWKGYPIHEASWEPIENLDGALDLVIDYNKKKKVDLGFVCTVSTYCAVSDEDKISRPIPIVKMSYLEALVPQIRRSY